MSRMRLAALLAVIVACVFASAAGAASPVYRIDHVVDGDTVALANGQRVRLVQIDTPEVYGGYECYGPSASAIAKRLLPPGTRVRLLLEPASEPVDRYGRLLRYVVRVSDGMNVNLRLVAVGAAAPWFYDGERGIYFAKLQALAKQARAKRLGLSTESVLRRWRTGDLPGYRLAGNVLRFRASEIEAWLEGHRGEDA